MAKKKATSARKSLEAERLRQQKIQEEEEAERKIQEEIQRKAEMQRKMEMQTKIAQSLAELENLEEIKYELDKTKEFKEKEEFETYKWNQYTRCDGNINPFDIKEINTFLSLWIENGSNKIDDILINCNKIMAMLEEINYAKKYARYDQEIDLEFFQEIESKLQSSMRQKIDMGTQKILENAIGQEVDFDTGNLHLVNSIDKIIHCIWGNLSKGIKTTSHQFNCFNFTFEIPRSIQTADVAIRLIWEHFDSLTLSSSAYKIRKVSTIPNKIKIVKNLVQINSPEMEVKESEVSQSSFENENISDTLTNSKYEENEENKLIEESSQNEFLTKDNNLEEELSEYNEFDLDVDFLDMRCYRTIGGLFHMELLNLPLQPITINQELVIKLLVDDSCLKKLNYCGENNENSKNVIFGSPIKIKFIFPDHFLITEQPDIALWDNEEKNWRTKHISEVTFDESNRMISFTATTIGTFAMIQEVHLHMPYQFWEIRPRAYNHVLLTIITSIVEFEIEIKEDLICLSSMQEYHALDHLLMKWVSLEVFVQALYDAGLNIFPNQDSNYFLKMNKKTKKLSNKVYLDISITSPIMGFSYSHFNGEADKDTCILQIAEPMGDEPINESDWTIITNSINYVQRLKVSEFETEFSSEPKDPNDEFHATLYKMSCSRDKKYSPLENWKLCKTLESFIKKIDILNYSV